MKVKKWLSAILVAAMAFAAVPAVGVQAADGDPAVTVGNLTDTAYMGTRTEFEVTTTGDYNSGGLVLGKFVLTAGDSSAVDLEYLETVTDPDEWRDLDLAAGTFGPSTGFPYTDGATSKFAVTFNAAGTYSFNISIVDASTQSKVASTSVTVTVPAADIAITDFGPWGESWPGAYNLGWQYINGFDTSTITSIRVGMEDKRGRTIVEYTADEAQVKWQQDPANAYITADGLSSAPFYKEYEGTPIEEGRDFDWTVDFGAGFNTWQPAKAYVEVVAGGTTYYKEIEYNGNFPCVHEFATHVDAKAATCTEAGNIEYWYCAECGKYFSDAAFANVISLDETILKATGHSAVKVEAKAPTADKAGNIAYWYCEKCGKYFSDEALTKEISKEQTVLAATGAKAADEKKADEVKAARTGDTTNVLVWGVLAVVAAGAVTACAKKRAK